MRSKMVFFVTNFSWCYLRFVRSRYSHLGEGFSAEALLIFGVGSPLLWGSCPLCCRMFSNIPGLYLLHASSISPTNCDNQKFLQTLSNVPVRGVGGDGDKISSSWYLLGLSILGLAFHSKDTITFQYKLYIQYPYDSEYTSYIWRVKNSLIAFLWLWHDYQSNL